MFEKHKTAKLRERVVATERAVFDKLDALHEKYNKRREGVRPAEKFRPLRDFLTETEFEEYARLARKHEFLCRALDKHSVFFDGRSHREHEPNSPIATRQVLTIENKPVELKKPDNWTDEDWFASWGRDEEFEANFRAWMEAKNLKFWKNMTPKERWEELDSRRKRWEELNKNE